jgi:hypothetical protein
MMYQVRIIYYGLGDLSHARKALLPLQVQTSCTTVQVM